MQYLTELVVITQILFIVAAEFSAQQQHLAVVFPCRHIAVSSLELVVKGEGCKVQRVSVDARVSGHDKIHCTLDTGLQVRQREKSLQKLQERKIKRI